MSGKYDDMLELPHPEFPNHPRMPVASRAAIFSPFAALTGHADAIAETARQTQQQIELDEDSRLLLDQKQKWLEEIITERPEVAVTWFQPDARKEGGSYAVTSGRLKKLDPINRVMVLEGGPVIPLDDVLDMDSDRFPGFLYEM